jgi:hypothetical protein
MEPEIKTEKLSMNVNNQEPGGLSPISSDEASEQLKKVWERTVDVLSDLPEYVSEFYGSYKRPISTIALVVGAIIGVKVVFAILGAINDLPLLSPLFELIGMGYTGWFIYRYLWLESSRKELTDNLGSIKGRVMGGRKG